MPGWLLAPTVIGMHSKTTHLLCHPVRSHTAQTQDLSLMFHDKTLHGSFDGAQDKVQHDMDGHCKAINTATFIIRNSSCHTSPAFLGALVIKQCP
jgi:hypothetical protein